MSSTPADVSRAPKKVVLLVDDSKLILQMEESLLAGMGFHLVKAATGREAIELVQREKPSLVLLDFFLPDVNGDEVAKAIRANPETAGTSIIVVTTGGSEEQKEKCFEMGANDFITKPIDSSVLKLKVDRLINIAPRTPYRILVKIAQAGSSQRDFVFGSSVNISETGIMLESDRKFDIGTEVDLQFYATTSRTPIAARGIVVRSQKKGFRGTTAYGVTFLALSPEARENLRELIARKLTEGGAA